MASTVKIELPELKDSKTYRAFRQMLEVQLQQHEAYDEIQHALENGLDDPVYAAPDVARKRAAYRAALSAVCKALPLGSAMSQEVAANQCKTLVQILRLLDRQYLDMQSIDVSRLCRDFERAPWDPSKESLQKFITNEWSIVQRPKE